LLGNAANAYGQTYGQEAAADMQASGNLLNLGQNVLRAGTGAISPTSILGRMFG
jgi:hypothetical protein